MEDPLFYDRDTARLAEVQGLLTTRLNLLQQQPESGCRPNECLFPNCQCTDAPTRVGTPGDINHQINFVRGMREVLQANKDAQVVMDAQHVAMLLAVEETLLAARLIQKALRS